MLKDNFDPKAILQGNKVRDELRQNPSTFSTDAGVVQAGDTRPLEKSNKPRMAGEVGGRILELMDPKARKETDNWMKMFNTSNQGAEFNQAKMGPVDKPKKEGAES